MVSDSRRAGCPSETTVAKNDSGTGIAFHFESMDCRPMSMAMDHESHSGGSHLGLNRILIGVENIRVLAGLAGAARGSRLRRIVAPRCQVLRQKMALPRLTADLVAKCEIVGVVGTKTIAVRDQDGATIKVYYVRIGQQFGPGATAEVSAQQEIPVAMLQADRRAGQVGRTVAYNLAREESNDVTVVAFSRMVLLAEQAARQAAGDEVVTNRSLAVVVRDFEQEACFILLIWALAIMGYKAVTLSRERRLLDVDLVPVAEGMRILPEDTREFARQVQALPEDRQRMLLPRALLNALRRFSTTRNRPSFPSRVAKCRNQGCSRAESERTFSRTPVHLPFSALRRTGWAAPDQRHRTPNVWHTPRSAVPSSARMASSSASRYRASASSARPISCISAAYSWSRLAKSG